MNSGLIVNIMWIVLIKRQSNFVKSTFNILLSCITFYVYAFLPIIADILNFFFQLVPGPPFVFGAFLVICAIFVASFIPSKSQVDTSEYFDQIVLKN